MNLDNFPEFLSDPSTLYRITYQELKSLVLQYPSCYNLRLLLLQKSRIEKHPDFDRNLQLAATYALDRKFLFDQLQHAPPPIQPERSLEMHEDFLELKSLSEVPVVIETPKLRQNNSKKEQLPDATSEEKSLVEWVEETDEENDQFFEDLLTQPGMTIDELLEAINSQDVEEHITQQGANEPVSPIESVTSIESTVESVYHQAADNFAGIFDAVINITSKTNKDAETPTVIELEITNSDRVAFIEDSSPLPLPKSAFTSWLEQYESPRSYLKNEAIKLSYSEQTLERLKKHIKSQEPDAEAIAERSLEENADSISETLAELLVAQGQIEKAVKMFRQLALKYPQKSLFFAARIENLIK